MELRDCDNFVKSATGDFRVLALAKGCSFEVLKKYFWIRCPDKSEVLQGNFETNWLRGFMHDLQPSELQQLRMAVPYKRHCRRGDGHQFRIENQHDVDVVMAIVAARCGA